MNLFQWRSNNVFEMKYRCHSMAVKGASTSLDNGGKILLPPSALDFLSRLQISWPVFFNVRNPSGGRQTHCGVQEFTAEEGTAYFPYWMMRHLNLQEGSIVVVRQVKRKKKQKKNKKTTFFLWVSNLCFRSICCLEPLPRSSRIPKTFWTFPIRGQCWKSTCATIRA
jgi:ubiquitin fusion degradation protein 1